MLATLYAAHAAVIIDAARREVQLREAMASRDVIGQAKGILMAQGGVNADEAFGQLRLASQRLNVKLRDLASDVVSRRERDAAEQPSAP
jgi:AmiR/NasT family two-component response regulator